MIELKEILKGMRGKDLRDGSLVKLILKKGARCVEMNHYIFPEKKYQDKTERQIVGIGFYLDKFNITRKEVGITLVQNQDIFDGRLYNPHKRYEDFNSNPSLYHFDAIESFEITNEVSN